MDHLNLFSCHYHTVGRLMSSSNSNQLPDMELSGSSSEEQDDDHSNRNPKQQPVVAEGETQGVNNKTASDPPRPSSDLSDQRHNTASVSSLMKESGNPGAAASTATPAASRDTDDGSGYHSKPKKQHSTYTSTLFSSSSNHNHNSRTQEETYNPTQKQNPKNSSSFTLDDLSVTEEEKPKETTPPPRPPPAETAGSGSKKKWADTLSSDDEDDDVLLPSRDDPPKKKTKPKEAPALSSSSQEADPPRAPEEEEQRTTSTKTQRKPDHPTMDLTSSDDDDDDETADPLRLSSSSQSQTSQQAGQMTDKNFVDLSLLDDTDDDEDHHQEVTATSTNPNNQARPARKSVGGAEGTAIFQSSRRRSRSEDASSSSSSSSSDGGEPPRGSSSPARKKQRTNNNNAKPKSKNKQQGGRSKKAPLMTEEQLLLKEIEMDGELEVGSRVYCPYPTDGMTQELYHELDHYFGEITSKEPRPNSPAAAKASGRHYYYVYAIKFDDGDVSGDPLRPRYISHENNAPLAERAKLQKTTQEKPKATKKRGRPTKDSRQRNGSVTGTTATSSTSSSNDVKQEENGKHGAQEEKAVNANDIIQAKLLSMESKRCLTCHECTAPKCGRCFFCRNEETNRLGLCFSKICSAIRRPSRRLPAVATLPNDMEFAIEGGQLIIVDHLKKDHNGVAKAMALWQDSFRLFDPEKFFSHIGFDVEPLPNEKGETRLRSYTPAELFQKRCDSCSQCRLDDCGRCESCRHNKDQTGFREVCLRKFCCTLRVELVQQKARGFPPGWTFSFDQGRGDDDSTSTEESSEIGNLLGLRLFSPRGNEYSSIKRAKDSMSARSIEVFDDEKGLETFYKQVGAPCLEVIEGHFLTGKCFFEEWLDIEGRTRQLFGTISKVERSLPPDTDSDASVATIAISDHCKRWLHCTAPDGVDGRFLAKNEICLNIKRAWAGYARYCSTNSVEMEQIPPFIETLVAPSAYFSDMHYEGDNNPSGLPRLQLQHRGFLLTFMAKKSTIEGAGWGVFLSCRSLRNDKDRPPSFTLRKGELLDIGVYAPLQPKDESDKDIVLLKNFVLGGKPETFTFDLDAKADYVLEERGIFDITDDFTGELNVRSRRSLPPYVNEVTDPKSRAPEVHAKYDPEGFLHYYLGHEDGGDFELSEGEEIEIFIDYGVNYEDVRVRSGYSRLSQEKAERRLKHLKEKEEPDVLHHISNYSVSEVTRSVLYFFDVVSTANRPIHEYPLVRLLTVSLMLKKRIEVILQQIRSVSSEHLCYDQHAPMEVMSAYKQVLETIKLVYNEIGNDAEVQRRLLEEEKFHPLMKQALGVEKEDSLESLSSGEFRQLATCSINFD